MLTEHFSLAELLFSEYAVRHHIDNTPTDEIAANLQTLAEGLERARLVLNRPMVISSGYRCPKVNSAIGGSRGSFHMKGLAADFRVPGLTIADACTILDRAKWQIQYDKLILEYGRWIHLQFPDVEMAPRLTSYIITDSRGYRELEAA